MIGRTELPWGHHDYQPFFFFCGECFTGKAWQLCHIMSREFSFFHMSDDKPLMIDVKRWKTLNTSRHLVVEMALLVVRSTMEFAHGILLDQRFLRSDAFFHTFLVRIVAVNRSLVFRLCSALRHICLFFFIFNPRTYLLVGFRTVTCLLVSS